MYYRIESQGAFTIRFIMDGLFNKLVCLSKLVEVTDNNKDTSLISNMPIFSTSVMFYRIEPGVDLIKLSLTQINLLFFESYIF
jgi:hypothetical protein